MTTPKIDAYFEEARGQHDLYPEGHARRIGSTPELLKELLLDKVTMLMPKWQKVFKGARFDFERKMLIGKDGYFLLWSLRLDPTKPQSLHNQQTSMGLIMLCRGLEQWGRHR